MRMGNFRKQPQRAATDLVRIWLGNPSAFIANNKELFFINIVTPKGKMRMGDIRKHSMFYETYSMFSMLLCSIL